MDVDGKIAIVTGAAGGGCAIAQRLAQEGATVVDVNEADGRDTVALIEAVGRRAAFFCADVSKEDEVRALFAFAESSFGGLDILVNNISGGVEGAARGLVRGVAP
jgi:NAD(P)-dependent dehydrogenase (short-subunit alcohol dehydrogenase family)